MEQNTYFQNFQLDGVRGWIAVVLSHEDDGRAGCLIALVADVHREGFEESRLGEDLSGAGVIMGPHVFGRGAHLRAEAVERW